MRKQYLLFLLFLSFSICSFGQEYTEKNISSFGIGYSYTNLDVGSASQGGVNFEIDYKKFHLDFAGNGAKGKGEYLDFESYKTIKADKQKWFSFSLGYNWAIFKGFSITTKSGLVFLRDIWEDPIGWDTYFEKNGGVNMQVGIDLKYMFDKFYIKLGSGTTEVYKVSIGIPINI